MKLISQFQQLQKVKKKLQGTEETEICMVIYSAVNRYTRGQLGVMIWTNK
jgi:hypothetical protein